MNTTSNSRTTVSTTDKKRKISNKALFALVFYFIIPIIAITSMMFSYPELSRDRLIGILQRTLPIGIMLILISQFGVRYEKGTWQRFVLSEAYVLLVLLWLFALLGGQPVIHQTWKEYNFSLHIWNYLILILFVTSINIIYYAVEYQAYSHNDEESESTEVKEHEDEDSKKHKGVIITTVQAQ